MTHTPFRRFILVLIVALAVVFVPWCLDKLVGKPFYLYDQSDPVIINWLAGFFIIVLLIAVCGLMWIGIEMIYEFIKDGE